jgi:hypothetical protein
VGDTERGRENKKEKDEHGKEESCRGKEKRKG